MFKIIGLMCSILLPLALRAETVPLDSHGSLEIVVPAGWKLQVEPISDSGHTLQISPGEAVNAICVISVMYPPTPKPVDQEEIEKNLREACSGFVAGSVEHKVTVHGFGLAAGYGIYATLTDASMVGKPSRRGEYKVMTIGLVQFSDDVMAVINLLTDDEHGKEQKELMGAVSSMKLKAAK